MPAQGSWAAGKLKNPKCKTAESAAQEFRRAFDIQCMGADSVSVQDMMEHLGITDKTVYARLKKMNGEFTLKKGRIYHNDQAQTQLFTGIPDDEEEPKTDA